MTQIILIRNNQYLNNRYQWTNIPDLIPDWHAPVVINVMLHEGNPQKPTGWPSRARPRATSRALTSALPSPHGRAGPS